MNQKAPKYCTWLYSSFLKWIQGYISRCTMVMILFACCVNNITAQVLVTITNPTNTVPNLLSSYPSLALAIADLNAVSSMSGPVVLTCGAGSETAPPGGYILSGTVTSASAPITISGAITGTTTITAALQVSGNAAASYDAVFKIVGGDYITIAHFTMLENVGNLITTVGPTNSMTEFGVLLTKTSTTNGAQYNTIRDNTILLNSAYPNSVGIFSSSASSSVNTTQDAISVAGTNSYNAIYHNQISNVAYGIYFICPPVTAAVFETGNDIGGTDPSTGNTIFFGNATSGSGPWNRAQSTVQAGIYFRNGAGNSVRFNTVVSNNVSYSGSGGLNGVLINSGTVPVGITYSSIISDNTIELTTSGITPVTGIDFGHGLTSGTIIGNNNTITLSGSQSVTSSAAFVGIKANYTSATNTCNGNNITINHSFAPSVSQVYSGAITGVTLAGSGLVLTANDNKVTVNQTNSPTAASTSTISGILTGISLAGSSGTITALRDTILFNREANMSVASTSVFSGIITGIAATAAASIALNIGSAGNGCQVSVKETPSPTGISTFSNAIVYVSINAAHKDVNMEGNTFNTAGGSIRSTGSLDMILGGSATISGLLTLKGNSVDIDRLAPSGAVGFYTQTVTASGDPADSISSNMIRISNLSGTSTVTAINRLGGLAAAARNICNNTIIVTGTSTGALTGIVCGNSQSAVISGNSITFNTAGIAITGISGATGLNNGTISGNLLSLNSSSTATPVITGINASVSGPYLIFKNEFTGLSSTGGVTAAPIITGILIGAGAGNEVYDNRFADLSVSGANATGTVSVSGIQITGGAYTRVYANTFSAITTGISTGSATLAAIVVSGGTTNAVFANNIKSMTTLAAGSSTLVSGIRISGGTTDSIYNNIVGGLNASVVSSVDAIRGINITSVKTNSSVYVFYNTVFLNASSSGTFFGTSGIYHTASTTPTTASLILCNNIVVNTSTAVGTGFTVAYRRSLGLAGNLANYAGISDHNLFYTGTPGAHSLIYDDGTNAAQTLVAYQSLLAGSSRDSNSLDKDPQFISVTNLVPTSCHIDNTGIPVSSVIADYTNTIRGETPDIGAYEFTSAKPQSPLVNNKTYCRNAEPTALTATGYHTLVWYKTLTGGIGDTMVIPPTNLAGTLTYFVADSNAVTGCISNRIQQDIVITQPIGANQIGADQTVCNNDAPAVLTGSVPSGGDSSGYIYLWLSSTINSGEGFSNAPGVSNTQNYVPVIVTETTWFKRVVAVRTCLNDTSVAVKIGLTDAVGNNSISGMQSINTGTAPFELMGSIPSGGNDTLYRFQWQRSTINAVSGFVNASGNALSKNYSPTALVATTWFRRIVNSGTCKGDTSEVVQVTVYPAIANNTISGSQTIYSGEVPTMINGSLPSGGNGMYSYQWISSVAENSEFSEAPGANDLQHYAPGLMSQKTWFKRIVFSNGVADTSSGTVINITDTISVVAAPGRTICSGTIPEPIIGSTPLGGDDSTYTYLWLSANGPDMEFAPAPGIHSTKNYAPQQLTSSTWFKRIVSSGVCAFDTSAPIKITVNPVVESNTIVIPPSVIAGSIPIPLVGSLPTGGDGISYHYQWQADTSNTNQGFINAAGLAIGIDYAPTALWKTTRYRRIVTSGYCADTSSVMPVMVYPAIAGNTIGGAQTICAGNTASQLTGAMPAGGNNVYAFKWISSTINETSGFTNAGGTYTAQSYSPDTVLVKTWYRRIVYSTGGIDTSAAMMVDVNPLLIASVQITATSDFICGTTPVIYSALPVNGGTNPHYQWKLNGAVIGSDSVAYTSTSPSAGDTVYLSMTSNAAPCLSNTNAGSNRIQLPDSTVIPMVSIMVTDSQPCAGKPVVFTPVPVNGGIMPAYSWFWNGINVSTATSYTTASLSDGDSIVVKMVSSENCVSSSVVTSNTFRMNIRRGSAITTQPESITRCAGSSALFRATATGDGVVYYQWRKNGININGAVSSEYTIPLAVLSDSGSYAVMVHTTCDSVLSNNGYLTMNAPVSNNTITGSHTICIGSSANSIAGSIPVGGNGSTYAYEWLSSTTNANTGFVSAGGTHTNKDYFPGTLTTRTWFRRVVSSGGCAVDTSAAVEIKIMTPITNNIITGSHTICRGFIAHNLTGNIPSGGNDSSYTYRWLSSTTSADSGFVLATGANAARDYFPGILNAHTWFRRVILSGICPVDTSLPVDVNIMLPVANNIILGSQIICRGSPADTISGSLPDAGNGSSYMYFWQSSTGLSGGFFTANGISNNQSYSPGVLTEHTRIRRVVVSGICPADTSNEVGITVNIPGTWSGTVSSAWNDIHNWTCPFIPIQSTNVTIPASAVNMPVITDVQQTADILIQTGAGLTLNTNSSVITIFGTITNNGAFTNTNGKVVMAGNAIQMLPAGTYAKLEINNRTGVFLGGDVLLTDSIILKEGKVRLDSYNLTLKHTAFATDGSATSYIVTNSTGSVVSQNIGAAGKMGDVFFPVGNSSYNPVILNNTTGSADDYAVSVMDSITGMYNGSTPIGSKISSGAVNRTWMITETVVGGSDASVILHWAGNDELSGFNRSASYIAQHNGTAWMSAPSVMANGTDPYFITRNHLTSFSAPFGVGSGSILPLAIIQFKGYKQNGAVRLDWITASELNNDHFILERSIDNQKFESLTKVKGNGTTLNKSEYTYLDVTARKFADTTTTIYYRLVQVDYDGTKHISGVVAINMGSGITKAGMNIIPNPFTGNTGVYILSDTKGRVLIRVTDVQGKLVLEKQILLEQGENRFVFEELVLAQPGEYFFNMITANGSFVYSLIKTNH